MGRAADSLMLSRLSSPLWPQSIHTPAENHDREKWEKCKVCVVVLFQPGTSARGREIHMGAVDMDRFIFVIKEQTATLVSLNVTGASCREQL